MNEILGKRNIKNSECSATCTVTEMDDAEIKKCIENCPEEIDENTNTNTSGGLEYWVNTGLGWLGQGADIYTQVKSGNTGSNVQVTDLEEANKENDYSKYYIYGGIGFGVIILLLIFSKVIANKNK